MSIDESKNTTALEETMASVLAMINEYAISRGHNGPENAKTLAEAYHLLACTRVLVPYTPYPPTEKTVANMPNVEKS